jgi:hypothetical protein
LQDLPVAPARSQRNAGLWRHAQAADGVQHCARICRAESERTRAQRDAVTAFAVRVASAAIL